MIKNVIADLNESLSEYLYGYRPTSREEYLKDMSNEEIFSALESLSCLHDEFIEELEARLADGI